MIKSIGWGLLSFVLSTLILGITIGKDGDTFKFTGNKLLASFLIAISVLLITL